MVAPVSASPANTPRDREYDRIFAFIVRVRRRRRKRWDEEDKDEAFTSGDPPA